MEQPFRLDAVTAAHTLLLPTLLTALVIVFPGSRIVIAAYRPKPRRTRALPYEVHRQQAVLAEAGRLCSQFAPVEV